MTVIAVSVLRVVVPGSCAVTVAVVAEADSATLTGVTDNEIAPLGAASSSMMVPVAAGPTETGIT